MYRFKQRLQLPPARRGAGEVVPPFTSREVPVEPLPIPGVTFAQFDFGKMLQAVALVGMALLAPAQAGAVLGEQPLAPGLGRWRFDRFDGLTGRAVYVCSGCGAEMKALVTDRVDLSWWHDCGEERRR